jgi:hypothetical protein
MRLKHYNRLYNFSAHIIDIRVAIISADAFVEVRHGILRLRCGPILCGTIVSLKSHIGFNTGGFNKSLVRLDIHEELSIPLHFLPTYKVDDSDGTTLEGVPTRRELCS